MLKAKNDAQSRIEQELQYEDLRVATQRYAAFKNIVAAHTIKHELNQIQLNQNSLHAMMSQELGFNPNQPIDLRLQNIQKPSNIQQDFIKGFNSALQAQTALLAGEVGNNKDEMASLQQYLTILDELLSGLNQMSNSLQSRSKFLSGQGWGLLKGLITRITERKKALQSVGNATQLAATLKNVAIFGTPKNSVSELYNSFLKPLGLVLGHLAETQFTQALSTSKEAERLFTETAIQLAADEAPPASTLRGKTGFYIAGISYQKKTTTDKFLTRLADTQIQGTYQSASGTFNDANYLLSVKQVQPRKGTTDFHMSAINTTIGALMRNVLLTLVGQGDDTLPYYFYRIAGRGYSDFDGSSLKEFIIAMNIKEAIFGADAGSFKDEVTDFVINERLFSAGQILNKLKSDNVKIDTTPKNLPTTSTTAITPLYLAPIKMAAIDAFNNAKLGIHWELSSIGFFN